MELTGDTLNEKLEEQRKKFFKKIEKTRELFIKADFVTENEWLNNQEKAKVSIFCSSLFNPEMSISVSNVKIEDFIEEVLGPYHRKYNVYWEMEAKGEEKSGSLIFRVAGDTWYNPDHPYFIIKEGEFESCRFRRTVVGFSQPKESEPIYKTELICE